MLPQSDGAAAGGRLDLGQLDRRRRRPLPPLLPARAAALGDPGLRHTAATIGHARSRDLVDWEVILDPIP